MKICQIAPTGGNPAWQKLGLKEIPETKWLVLLANIPEDTKNFLQEAKELKKELEEEQKDFPDQYQVKISVLDLTEIDSDYYQLLGYFKELFDIVISSGYKISINGSSGLQIWKLALYQIALMFNKEIHSYFLFNKKNQKMEKIWIQHELDKNDLAILEILKDKNEISLGDLQNEFNSKLGKGNLSYMVKLTEKLEKNQLVISRKKGRVKYVKLNEIGKNIAYQENWKDIIKKEIDVDNYLPIL
ncbi:MAG: winged helix-turn-helix domain-containing protein [Candidatus Hodarchaeales archaeon]|jgi:DNA-binding transcriptional ArsR family regulator